VTITNYFHFVLLLLGTRDEFFIVREGFLVLHLITPPLIIIGILLLALDWTVIFSMEFVEEDRSQSLVGLKLSAWFSLRLVSG